MLRDLGRKREDGTNFPRTGDCDPTDSVFLVLLWDEENDHPVPYVASAWLSLGEAQGAAHRYVNEGHKAHHGWLYATVMEYQTGQLAPKSERHGDPYFPPKPAAEETVDDRISALELELVRLKAAQGQKVTSAV